MELLQLAWRNLWRNWRRTLITSTAIIFGVFQLIVSVGLGDGMYNAMIDDGVSQMAGHVVIQGEGFQEERESAVRVPQTPEVVEALAAAVPEARILRRAFVEGLLTSPTGSVGVAMTRETTTGTLCSARASAARQVSPRSTITIRRSWPAAHSSAARMSRAPLVWM